MTTREGRRPPASGNDDSRPNADSRRPKERTDSKEDGEDSVKASGEDEARTQAHTPALLAQLSEIVTLEQPAMLLVSECTAL